MQGVEFESTEVDKVHGESVRSIGTRGKDAGKGRRSMGSIWKIVAWFHQMPNGITASGRLGERMGYLAETKPWW